MRNTPLSLIPLLAALAVSCSRPVDWEQVRPLEAVEVSRLHLETHWADARTLPGGAPQPFTLGTIPPGAQLRLSVREGRQPRRAVRVEVFADDRRLARFATRDRDEWLDVRTDLSDAAGAECRVVFRSRAPFHVAACEFVVPDPHPPNVLIFLIDTLRQDHVGCYGYHRDTTPRLDALAAESVLFTQLMPPSSWTKPSVASLLTSTHPQTHGANDVTDRLRANLPRLARSLETAGYETHGYVSNLNCLPLWGIGTEFHRHSDIDSAEWMQADDARVVDAVIDFLPFLQGRPWLLYVHTMGPHAPYDPPAGFDTRFRPDRYEGDAETAARQMAVDLYDGEIAYSDLQLGRLLDALHELGLYDNTLIIVLSDHGEEFWEHGGTDHGQTLYEEQLRVPLVVKMPGAEFAGERRDALVEMIDIAPTILDIVGAAPESRFQGRSLLDYIRTDDIADRVGYAMLTLNRADVRTAKSTESKYIRDIARGAEAWFDLVADPGERAPLPEGLGRDPSLARYVEYMEDIGRHGLHILVTREPGTSHEFACRIETERFGAYSVRFPFERGVGLQTDGGLVFRLQLRDIEGEVRVRSSERVPGDDHAHIHIEMPDDAYPVITVTLDDAAVDRDSVFLGAGRASEALTEHRLDLAALHANCPDFRDAYAARSFGVYVWYVPQDVGLDPRDLDPGIRDALRGLGYLD